MIPFEIIINCNFVFCSIASRVSKPILQPSIIASPMATHWMAISWVTRRWTTPISTTVAVNARSVTSSAHWNVDWDVRRAVPSRRNAMEMPRHRLPIRTIQMVSYEQCLSIGCAIIPMVTVVVLVVAWHPTRMLVIIGRFLRMKLFCLCYDHSLETFFFICLSNMHWVWRLIHIWL